MLGSAIGDVDHTNNWVRRKVLRRVEPLLANLCLLEDPQAQFLILYYCINYCHMVFFIQTSPPNLLNDATKEYDELIHCGLEGILGKALEPSV